jgi:hypothetical protein
MQLINQNVGKCRNINIKRYHKGGRGSERERERERGREQERLNLA